MLEEGAVFAGRYRVVTKLGEGGMGAVYRVANDVGEEVALKVLAPEVAGDAEAQQRFLAEVAATKALVHKRIVQVRDSGRDGSALYFTMDLVRGRDLGKVLAAEGPLEPSRVVRLGAQVLEGLEEAHGLGLVHRDLKPANVMLTEAGDARVLDFGIAKAASSTAPSLTKKNTTLGTITHMSPEQAQGLDLDGRSDLYSLGVVLYELLSGKLPVEADPRAKDTERSFLTNLLVKPPVDLRSVAPRVPSPLAEVVMRALAKEPGQRFADARSMREALLSADVPYVKTVREIAVAAPPPKTAAPPPRTAAPLPRAAEPLPGAPIVHAPPKLVAPARNFDVPARGAGGILAFGFLLVLGGGVGVAAYLDVGGVRTKLLGAGPSPQPTPQPTPTPPPPPPPRTDEPLRKAVRASLERALEKE